MSDPIITNINKAMIQLQTEDRIEQLERELRLAKVQIGNLDKLNTDKAIGLGEKYREIADLRAKLEAAERDAARLEHLMARHKNALYRMVTGETYYGVLAGTDEYRTRMRAAIDAAMQK